MLVTFEKKLTLDGRPSRRPRCSRGPGLVVIHKVPASPVNLHSQADRLASEGLLATARHVLRVRALDLPLVRHVESATGASPLGDLAAAGSR
jgi:hypothetical protein